MGVVSLARRCLARFALAAALGGAALGVGWSAPANAQEAWWPAGWYAKPSVPPEPRLVAAGGYADLAALPVPVWWDTSAPLDVLSVAVVRLYQTAISPHRAGACPMEPSCSRYGLQALHEAGWFQGWLMTLDRLFLRENPGMAAHVVWIEVDGVPRPFDPPAFDDLSGEVPWPLKPSDLRPAPTLARPRPARAPR
jgi:putative component of membrane protein insertase Oxa1/YidC/SpoIIIJ protein YidD